MATDLMMWVGKEYKLYEFIEEARRQGVSKRIPKNMIPEITPGESRLFLVYPEAVILTKATYYLLALDLRAFGYLNDRIVDSLQDEFPHPEYMELTEIVKPDVISLRIALEHLKEAKLGCYNNLLDEYEIDFHPGIFGYTYLTGVQYVLWEDENGLPEVYQHLKDLVEPVRVVRAEEKDEQE